MQDLFENSCKTQVLPINCDLCNAPKQTSQKVVASGEFLIIQVQPMTLNNDLKTKLPLKIKQIPTKLLNIGDSIYKFQCMAVHHGDFDDNAHYTSILRKNDKYILADDRRITANVKWPTCGHDEMIIQNEVEGYKVIRKTPSLLFYKKTR